MKNTLIAILVIAVIVIGYLFIKEKTKPTDYSNVWPETEPATPTKDQTNIPHNENSGWNKSPVFGLYYPEAFSITEIYQDPSSMTSGTPENGVPKFEAYSAAHNELMILWGGYQGSGTNCTSNDLESFQYGVSQYVCLKGRPASIGHVSARATVTSAELKLFGDFVIKNQ